VLLQHVPPHQPPDLVVVHSGRVLLLVQDHRLDPVVLQEVENIKSMFMKNYKIFFDKYNPLMERFARTLIKDNSRAVIITSEAFRQLGEVGITDENKGKAFLYNAASDLCLEHLRRLKKQLEYGK
jgi:DNA-directed RNA polymerase specialized sigma24 family protein